MLGFEFSSDHGTISWDSQWESDLISSFSPRKNFERKYSTKFDEIESIVNIIIFILNKNILPWPNCDKTNESKILEIQNAFGDFSKVS